MKYVVIFILLTAAASCKKGSDNGPTPPAVLRDGLYVNGYMGTGTLSNSGVAAPAGYQWRECQNDLGSSTVSNFSVGVSNYFNAFASYKLADDFIVPAGQTWKISRVSVYAMPNFLSNGIFDSLRIQIWKGSPAVAGSTVVFGDMTTNTLSTVVDSMTCAIQNSSVPAPGITPVTIYKVKKLSADINTTLSPGTYWLVYQAHLQDGNDCGSPYAKVKGKRGLPEWNAVVFNAFNIWQPVVDRGIPTTYPAVPLDVPFEIVYKY